MDPTCSSSGSKKSKTRAEPQTPLPTSHPGAYSVSHTHTHTLMILRSFQHDQFQQCRQLLTVKILAPNTSWNTLLALVSALMVSVLDLHLLLAIFHHLKAVNHSIWWFLFVFLVKISMKGPYDYISPTEWPLMVVRTHTQTHTELFVIYFILSQKFKCVSYNTADLLFWTQVLKTSTKFYSNWSKL